MLQFLIKALNEEKKRRKMKPILSLALVALSLAFVSGQQRAGENKAGASFDKFFDNFLTAAIKKHYSELEPLKAENVQSEFRGPLFMKGTMKLETVTMNGASNIKRSGETFMRDTIDGKQRLIRISMSIDNVNFESKAQIRYGPVNMRRIFAGRLNRAAVTVLMQADKTTKDVKVIDVRVTTLDGLRVWSTSRDRLLNLFLRVTTGMFGGTIRRTVAARAKKILGEEINNHPMKNMLSG